MAVLLLIDDQQVCLIHPMVVLFHNTLQQRMSALQTAQSQYTCSVFFCEYFYKSSDLRSFCINHKGHPSHFRLTIINTFIVGESVCNIPQDNPVVLVVLLLLVNMLWQHRIYLHS